MKVNDYDYVTVDKNKTHSRLTGRVKVGKNVQNQDKTKQKITCI